MTASVDVSRFDDVAGLETAVRERFGGTDILMNNAGIGPDSNMLRPLENWQRFSRSICGASFTARRPSRPA